MTTSYQIYPGKVILRIHNTICDTADEMLSTEVFADVFKHYIQSLTSQRSKLLRIFPHPENITVAQIRDLLVTLRYLVKLRGEEVRRLRAGSWDFLHDEELLDDFVEGFYNYWRSQHRLVVCDSIGDRYDQRPYRTFTDTVETLMDVVRGTYRDLRESITGEHPRIYRQVSAGAEIGVIASQIDIPYESDVYTPLNRISVTNQVLIYPPMIFDTPMNKRSGVFQKVDYNPIAGLELDPAEWLCYPAKVGDLLVMTYFSVKFFELGFSLSNLFELAKADELRRKPDCIYLFGVPAGEKAPGQTETVFYDDEENKMLVATIPYRDEFAYFGYLKKMILTLHNVVMLKKGRFPYHGAMFHIVLRDRGGFNFLLIGDSGAGKSETLEALRHLIKDEVEELTIIADDMGSLEINASNGRVIGYGTEMGAFVRLDDLQSGYALGQIDRTIIMNPEQVNARVVLPVTKYGEVIRGYPVDYVMYANNYEPVDEEHPVIDPFKDMEAALDVFRAGAVMSKGTTTTKGLVHTYYANIFGPPMYPDLQEAAARRFFKAFFDQGVEVSQLRTQLGIPGMEMSGPQQAAKELLELIKRRGGSAG